jgi:hypothetical protein
MAGFSSVDYVLRNGSLCEGEHRVQHERPGECHRAFRLTDMVVVRIGDWFFWFSRARKCYCKLQFKQGRIKMKLEEILADGAKKGYEFLRILRTTAGSSIKEMIFIGERHFGQTNGDARWTFSMS